jgi:hypothetical protein
MMYRRRDVEQLALAALPLMREPMMPAG